MSDSRRSAAVLPNLAWLGLVTKIKTNCMGSHVIFILKKENAGDDDFNQMDIPSFRAESDHTYHQKELVAVHRDSSHSSLDSNILV